MTSRIQPFAAAPEAISAMMALSTYVSESGLEYSLQELVKIRASQINGCAYCIDMHWKDARAAGQSHLAIRLAGDFHLAIAQASDHQTLGRILRTYGEPNLDPATWH